MPNDTLSPTLYAEGEPQQPSTPAFTDIMPPMRSVGSFGDPEQAPVVASPAQPDGAYSIAQPYLLPPYRPMASVPDYPLMGVYSQLPTTSATINYPSLFTPGYMVWQGEWQDGFEYNVDDVVYQNVSTYIAIQSSNNNPPDQNVGTYWQLVGENFNYRGQWAANNFTIKQASTGTASSSTVAAVSPGNVTAGNWLIVAYEAYFTSPTTSNAPTIADTLGNSWTQLALPIAGSTGSTTLQLAIFGCQSAFSGANTITVTGSISGSGCTICAVEYNEGLLGGFGTPSPFTVASNTGGVGKDVITGADIPVLVAAAYGNASTAKITFDPTYFTLQEASGGSGGTGSGKHSIISGGYSSKAEDVYAIVTSSPDGSGAAAYIIPCLPGSGYLTTTKYNPFDVVIYQGSTYVCIYPTNTDPIGGLGTTWVLLAQGTGFSSYQSGNYTAVATDNGTQQNFTITSAATFTLPATAPNNGWWLFVQNNLISTAVLTISPNSLNLDYSTSSIYLTPGQGLAIFSDGNNYFTQRASVSAGGVTTYTAGGSYQILPSDNGKLIAFSSTTGTAVLPASPPKPGWWVSINTTGVSIAVSPNGKTLDGSSSSLTVLAGQGLVVFTDGTNYFSMRGISPRVAGVLAKTANYVAQPGDSGYLISFTSASNLTLTLSNVPFAGYFLHVQNAGTGTLTVSPNGLNLDGSSSSLVLEPTQGIYVTSDGTNYFTERGMGGGGLGAGVNSQTGTTYTFLSTDSGKLVTFTNTSAIAATLPVASTTGFGSTWYTDVQNIGAVGHGWVTITPTTSTIDGAATLVVQAGSGTRIFSNGTNYFTDRGAASLSLDNLTDYWPGRESQFYRPAQFTTDVCIDNACFEASTVMVNGAPPGWYDSYLTSGYTSLSFNTTTPYIGDRSLRITGVTGTSGGGCAQNRVITVVPGETYQISGWIKTDGTCTGTINLILTNYPISVATEITATSTASSWTYVTASGSVPTGAGSGGYCLGILQLNSSGGTSSSVCDFDMIRIHRIFGASGTYSSPGMVPDPGATVGTSRFLREDASWQNPTFSGTDITLAAIDLIGQTSSISPTNFANTGTGLAAGMYIAQIFVDVTTAGSAGTLTTTIAYTTDSGSDSQTTATTSLATLGTNSGFTIPFYATANTAISYATTVASVVGSPVYTLHIRLIQVATTATLYAAGGVNSQTANYLAVAGDMGKLITMNGSSLTLTLPATPPSSLWWCSVENTNASSLTLSPNSLDIDGSASSITVAQNTGLGIFSDGTNYFTMRGMGGGGSSAFSAITSGTNTAAAMVVGAGASLGTASTGTIAATSVGGITVTGTPSAGNVLTATSGTAADWAAPGSSSGVPDPNTTRWYYWNADGSQMFSPASTGSVSLGGVSLTIANPGGGSFGFNSFLGSYVSTYSSSGALTDFCTGNSGGLTKPFYMGNNIRFQSAGYWYNATGTGTASVDWMGFTDQTPTTMGAGGNPAGNYAAFRFIAGTDTNIQCITKDGTTQTVTDSGVAPSAGFLAGTAAFTFEIATSGSSNVKFYINGTLVATNTTHLPTAATAMNWQTTCKSASSIGIGPSMSYVYFESAH